jgi:hypothetical protein
MVAKVKKIVSSGFYVMGCVFLAVGVGIYFWVRDIQSWPQTDAVIERSGVEEFFDFDDGVRRLMYRPDVTFSYDVAGEQYRSSDYSNVTYSSSSKSTVLGWVAEFPAGSRASVYVSPKDPSTAYLTLSGSSFWGIFVGVGLAQFLIGFAVSRIPESWLKSSGDQSGHGWDFDDIYDRD